MLLRSRNDLSSDSFKAHRFEKFKDNNPVLSIDSGFFSKKKVFDKSVRKTIATADSVEFTVEPKNFKTPMRLNYLKKSVDWSIKGTNWQDRLYWAILLISLINLALIDRGLFDLNSIKQRIMDKSKEIKTTVVENQELAQEIKMLSNNKQYQKRMAREHLGVIAPDEYLILFAKD